MIDANELLDLLVRHRNVLLLGPPATGKSLLLAQVANLFSVQPGAGPPRHVPGARIPIPAVAESGLPNGIGAVTHRRVFRSVLHQSSKHRDFLTGVMPDLRTGAAAGTFRVTTGVLYRASEFAKEPDSAALLIIDEINRGPAVEVFGGSIVALEADKRLGPDGNPTPQTQYFDLLNPENGDSIEYAFPDNLYILAAMNQADVSVEPLDVAFLRRWIPAHLKPSSEVLRTHFGLGEEPVGDLPEVPTSGIDVLEAAVRAFSAINERITLGRGREFCLGHGMLMARGGQPASVEEALAHVATAWRLIKGHIDEVFFGDIRGIATILNADSGLQGNPYTLEETSFGGTPRPLINGPDVVTEDAMYGLLKALAVPSG